jgi:hypothetical protein
MLFAHVVIERDKSMRFCTNHKGHTRFEGKALALVSLVVEQGPQRRPEISSSLIRQAICAFIVCDNEPAASSTHQEVALRDIVADENEIAVAGLTGRHVPESPWYINDTMRAVP